MILAAAKQLRPGQSGLAHHNNLAASNALTATGASVQSSRTGNQDPAQQLTAEPALQAQVRKVAEGCALENSFASSASVSSSECDLGSTQAESRDSTFQSGSAGAHNQAADNANRPAPSQHQLQELYSQMEADYKRLQERPAHGRGSAKAPLIAAAQSGRAGTGDAAGQQPPARHLHGPGRASAKGLVSVSTSNGNPSIGSTERVGVAAAMKQTKKGKKMWPDEPYVQVYTNFHTLSQVRRAACFTQTHMYDLAAQWTVVNMAVNLTEAL